MDTTSGNKLGFMATLGQIGKFDPADESIFAYLEYVELFFAANSIEDKRQIAVFLSVIGHKNYTLHHDLQALKKPQKKSLTTLSETLRKYLEPKPVIIAEPFCFQQRDLANGESIVKHLRSRTSTTGNTLPNQRLSR